MPSTGTTHGLLYSETVLQTLAFCGFVIKAFLPSPISADGVHGPASSTIWGYGLVLLAVFGLQYVQFAFFPKDAAVLKAATKEDDPGRRDKQTLHGLVGGTWAAIIGSIPTVGVLLSVGFLIWLNSAYYTRINKGLVSDEYTKMSTASTVMLLLQLLLLGKEMFAAHRVIADPGPEAKAREEQKVSMDKSFAYLLSTLNLVFILMQYITLRYFSTDG